MRSNSAIHTLKVGLILFFCTIFFWTTEQPAKGNTQEHGGDSGNPLIVNMSAQQSGDDDSDKNAPLAPGAFGKISPSNGAVNRPINNLTLSWSPSSGATGYEYCVDTSPDNKCDYTPWTLLGDTTSVTVSGLASYTRYYWQVHSFTGDPLLDPGTDANNGTWFSFDTAPAPGAFGKIYPANNAVDVPNLLRLSWGASTNVTRYEYCFDYCSSSTSTTNTWADVNMDYSSTHSWTVCAIGPGGTTCANNGTSWNFTVWPQAPGIFNKSLPLPGTTDVTLNPTISWDDSPRARYYKYCYDTTNNNSCNGSWQTTTGLSASISGLSYETDYYWHVIAYNPGYATESDGGWWRFKTVRPPGFFDKTAPANNATNLSYNTTLSWGASAIATSYEYCYDTTNDSICNGTWISNGMSTSIPLSGLDPGATYYWQVRVNTNISTVYYANASTWWSFTTAPVPGAFDKTAPVNMATDLSLSPILSWGISSNAASYEYCYDTVDDSDCTGTWMGNGTNTSIALSGLSPNTSYYWQVRAITINGTTYANTGSWWSFTTASLPGAFDKINPTNASTNIPVSLSLSWGSSNNATSYEYCFDTINNATCNATWISAGTNTSVTLSGLSASTVYYWQVRANSASGSAYANTANWWSFTTAPLPVAFNKSAPTNNLTGVSINPTLTWAPSSTVTGYEYCIDTTYNSACDTSWIGTGTDTSAALSGLSASTVYYWQVRANGLGGTTYANTGTWWRFTTAPLPGAFNKTAPANNGTGVSINPTLTWGTSSNTISYEYCYDTSDNATCDSDWITTGTATTVTLSGLLPNTAYYWQVRAYSLGGTTYANTSTWWRFTTAPLPGDFSKSTPADAAVDVSIDPTLTWASASNATAYEYCYDTTDNDLCDGTWVTTGTNTSVALSSLRSSTPYFWQVRAIGLGGTTEANNGAWWQFTTQYLPFEDIDAALSGVYGGSVAWGDYDNDGDPDILLTGCSDSTCLSPITKVYRNDNGVFTDINAGLVGVKYSSVAWGDYDNDGDLDILLTGYTGSSYIAKVYLNDNGVFADINAGLTGVSQSSVAWGDYDNDGDPDILLTGCSDSTCSSPITKVYRNDNGIFTDINAGLVGVQYSSVAWGDYDNDGDLDILLSGSFIAKVYRNDNGVFTDINAGLTGVYDGSVAWGDYDNDGDLDILLTGLTGSNRIVKVYRNDNGAFTDTGAGLTEVWNSSVALGDYDNDGDLDILLTGSTGSSYVAKVYCNDDGGFTDIGAGLTGVGHSSVAWGDYDNDGDLDILLTGYTGSSYIAKVYLNNALIANTPPAAPTGLDFAQAGVTSLTWNAASDTQTPAAGLTYNLCIGTTPGGSQIVSPLANVSNGYRRLPTMGNGQLGTTFLLKNLPPGTYYWSVQAVDTAFAGSPFASEGSFTVIQPGEFNKTAPANAVTGISIAPTLTWENSSDATSYEYCYDTNNNSTCDTSWVNAGLNTTVNLSGLNPSTVYYWQVRANGTGALTYANAGTWWRFTTAPLPGAFNKTAPTNNLTGVSINPTLTWGTSSNTTSYEYCYDTSDNAACDSAWINTGTATTATLSGLLPNTAYFWQARAIGLGGTTYANAGTWWTFTTAPIPGDFSKSTPANAAVDVSINPTLTWASASNATTYEYCYDTTDNEICDGTWVATGTNTSVTLSSLWSSTPYYWQVRANGQSGTTEANGGSWWQFTTQYRPFEDIGAGLTGIFSGSVAWGDYDNDDDLDILLTGSASSSYYVSKVYRNDNGLFADINAALTGVSNSSVAWGDYDDDGDLDILLTGYTGSTYVVKVYRNDNGSFTDIGASLTGVRYSSVAWGDYDNDGDLDILLTGSTGSIKIAKVYRNDNGGFTDINAGLTGISFGSVAWGDYNNDGDLDILLTGSVGTSSIAKVYRNDNGGFTDIGAGLTGIFSGSVAWGDYDNDGDLDILLTGPTGSIKIAKVYRNDNGGFTDINAALTGVSNSSVAWGDYDNDGDLDILLTGYTGSTYVVKVYRNDNGVFTDINAGLAGVSYSSVAWGDYDNDGDLDILLTGSDGTSYIAKVYHNNTLIPNTAPATPTGLDVAQTGAATLSWNAASDAQTPAAGLTYNLRVGTTPGGSQIVSPMANVSNGYRRLPAMGNGQLGITFILKNLAPGTYYWSVQAVDTAFAGSPFASEGSFSVIQPGAFNKTAPANAVTGISIAPTLTWGSSSNTTIYEYCIDTTNNSTCDTSWVNAGTNTSAALSGLLPNTVSYWQVRANGPGGTTYANSGTWWSFTTAPLPGAFNKTAPANNASGLSLAPTLTWGTSSTATSYDYCYDTTDNAACDDSTWISTGMNTTAALSGLLPNTTYFWQVRANSPGGTTYANAGTWWAFTTAPLPGAFNKTAPANNASGLSLTPTLTWGASSNTTSYEYCYDTSDNAICDNDWKSTGAATAATLSGLLPNTAYYWQVRAIGLGGTTYANSGTWWRFTTVPLPGAFNKTAPANNATNQSLAPTLTWGTSSGTTSYEYCYDTSDNTTCDSDWTSTGAATTATLAELLPNTTYYWQVRANGLGGTTYADSGTWWRFTTAPTPGAFSKTMPVDAVAELSIAPTLTWENSSDATSYEYCYDASDNATCDTSWVSAGLNTTVNLSGLNPSTTYYWQVRANGLGGTTYANSGTWWSFTTKPMSISMIYLPLIFR